MIVKYVNKQVRCGYYSSVGGASTVLSLCTVEHHVCSAKLQLLSVWLIFLPLSLHSCHHIFSQPSG